MLLGSFGPKIGRIVNIQPASDDNIYALDHACSSARPKPLSKFVHYKWTQREGRIEESCRHLNVGCVIRGIHQLGRTPPVFGEVREISIDAKISRTSPIRVLSQATNQRLTYSQHTTPTCVTFPSLLTTGGHQRFDGGREEIGVEKPVDTATAASTVRPRGL